MNTLILDLETYYDPKTGYTLSKMTSEEYIRDPRFEIVGFSMGWKGQPKQWFSGDLDYLRGVLASIDWRKTVVVGHNMSGFDSLILTHHLQVRPRAYGCTLQLARCIHGSKTPDGKNLSNSLAALAKMYQPQVEAYLGRPLYKGDEVVRAAGKRRLDFTPQELAAYGQYACDDSDLAEALWHILSPQFPPSQIFLASTVTRMFAEPRILLDQDLLAMMRDDMAVRKADLLARVADLLGVGTTMAPEERAYHTQKLLGSNMKFAEVLRQFGVEPPMKPSPKQRDADGKAKMVYAFAKTDEGMNELLEYDEFEDDALNDIIQALAAARIGTKSTINESRVERFYGISTRGLLPVPLEYGKTVTERLAGCLVADTKIQCYDPVYGQCVKNIVDVMPDDLVWDGEEYVQHEGVVFSGYREVIEYDGITGTPDHKVFIDAEGTTLPLEEAKSRGTRIMEAAEPPRRIADLYR